MYRKTLEISSLAYIFQKPFYGLEGGGALFSGKIIIWERENLRFIEIMSWVKSL